MAQCRSITALGLMSGTSLDGIDAAIIKTDGMRVQSFGQAFTMPYADSFRQRLRDALGSANADIATIRQLTLNHAKAVKSLLAKNAMNADDIDIIGFHGHTILHCPANGLSIQIGDGQLLARETNTPVVCNFRSNDVANGGQGAPLVPLFHNTMAKDLKKPLAVVNIGGVANVTWLGEENHIIAFDTGPGNALIDDWILKATGKIMDVNGNLAASGKVDKMALANLLSHPYFSLKPPKSLDRDDFSMDAVGDLSTSDAAATLCAFTAHSIALATRFFPQTPKRWLICGGGRHNSAIMSNLSKILQVSVDAVEAEHWQGDYLEAQAFAFLAVRSFYGQPLTLPGTTGVNQPATGGVLYKPC